MTRLTQVQGKQWPQANLVLEPLESQSYLLIMQTVVVILLKYVASLFPIFISMCSPKWNINSTYE